jgi:hypothetical protein
MLISTNKFQRLISMSVYSFQSLSCRFVGNIFKGQIFCQKNQRITSESYFRCRWTTLTACKPKKDCQQVTFSAFFNPLLEQPTQNNCPDLHFVRIMNRGGRSANKLISGLTKN